MGLLEKFIFWVFNKNELLAFKPGGRGIEYRDPRSSDHKAIKETGEVVADVVLIHRL